MQDTVIKILTTLAMFSPIFLLLYNAKFKRINRRKLFFLPFLAFLYGAVVNVFLINKYIAFLALPKVYIILTMAIGGVYFVITLLYFVAAHFLFRNESSLTKPACFFYFYNQDFDKWFLKDSFVLFRTIFLVVSLVSCLTTVIYTALIRHFDFKWPYAAWLFLITSTIVLIEIFNFLNGFTAREYEELFGGDDSHATRISSFYRVRDILEQTFPDEVLTAETACDFSSQSDTQSILDAMENTGSKTDYSIAEFFRLNEDENIYDVDYIAAVNKMLHGKNVIFYNPFYRDLGKYVVLPIMDTLLKGKNVLMIVSRKSTQDDMIAWMDDLLYKYGRIRDLWKIEKMSSKTNECEVGVISFSQLYDLTIIENNREFLKDVGFVFLSEPSYILNTGQLGLSVVASTLVDVDGAPIYCVSDRITDGLVDTLSHVLRTEFAEVVAPPISRNIHSAIGWNADGDYMRQRLFGKQTRFLGNGMEIAAVAVKNQIPEVSWMGETKVPIRDIKWIAGQYYTALCGFMNIPLQQEKLYEKIKFIPNLWCAAEQKEQFVIAEDEFLNLFAAIRTFMSRGREQTFINILSENYLLRDYMRYNYRMFITNPDAIPSIVPGYVKSERNTFIKLLYNMTFRDVDEDEVLNELRLAGMDTDDAFYGLTSLLKKYSTAEDNIFDIYITNSTEWEKPAIKSVFRVMKSRFEEQFANTLKISFYVCEEEVGDTEYIDARLIGHATQCVLPGQYVTYDGKYYYVQSVSSENGVVLRRASNNYDGRKYYRQIRSYTMDSWTKENVLSDKTVMDINICKIMTGFKVSTTGYLEMSDNCNLRSARVIDFSEDPNVSKYEREYRNKSVLQIKLPDTTRDIRYTVSVLLSEIFKSVFPDGWQYLAVVCKAPDEIDGMLTYLMYKLEGSFKEDCIYIIEDSEMDLGLLDAIEKNLMKFMEITTDFLGWHFEKMRETVPPEDMEKARERAEKQKREIIEHALHSDADGLVETEEGSEIKFTKNSPDVEAGAMTQAESGPESSDNASQMPGFDSADEPQTESAVSDEGVTQEASRTGSEDVTQAEYGNGSVDATEAEDIISQPDESDVTLTEDETPDAPTDFAAVDGTDIFDESHMDEFEDYFNDEFEDLGISPLMKTRYQEDCFLKFGFDDVDRRLHLTDVHRYLIVRGFSRNSLRSARKRDEIDEGQVMASTVTHCDFCGLPLTGVCYERLDDGRVRCNDCTASAINSVDEMRKLFRRVRTLMESFYAIKFNVNLMVKMADAKKIARGFGSIYKKESPRVLGYAQKWGKNFSIFLENGSPKMAAIMTMSHELTHIWQYRHWDTKELRKHYPSKDQQRIIYEGMAVWASIQFLYMIGEYSYAQRVEVQEALRDDEYGEGFRQFRNKYPLIKDSSIIKHSPFTVKIEDLL